MNLEFTANRRPHVIEIDANPLSPCKFEGRNQVAVASDDHNRLHQLPQRQERNVQSYSKVNGLLLHVRD